MSNKKSNKGKKSTKSTQNNINAFRIEQLEPRLLMSATAALSLRAERGNPFRG
jgi:hypothetical protein